VLNINALANALKPVVLPGEELDVYVLKEGKEPGQGVAYLDDGTMVVIESGRKFMGRSLDVVVTSVLQTTAGRMIFAKVKEEGTSSQGESFQHRQEWQRG
nr:TRAM domain-containing protein [Pseudomonadota bacterium]